jgi:MFS family permease
MTETTTIPTTYYCYVHPTRETSLRCNRCERPICAQCAVLTPTGYRCKECVRSQQKIFDTAVWSDYIVAFVAASIGSAIASILVLIVSNFFFGLIVLLLAPSAGAAIGNIVRRFIKNRRSRMLFLTASVGIVTGGLPVLIVFGLPALFAVFAGGFQNIYSLLPVIWQVVYLVMAVPAAYSQLSGIRIGG